MEAMALGMTSREKTVSGGEDDAAGAGAEPVDEKLYAGPKMDAEPAVISGVCVG